MSRHSPGPWKWVEIGIDDEEALVPESYSKEDPTDVILTLGWVSMGDGSPGTEPSPEDARLIAAAPELLEALRSVLQSLRSVQKHIDNFYVLGYITEVEKEAADAVFKATGETY